MESWSLAVVAGLVVAFAAVSRRLQRTVVTAAIFFVSGGLLAGSEVLGWIDLADDLPRDRALRLRARHLCQAPG